MEKFSNAINGQIEYDLSMLLRADMIDYGLAKKLFAKLGMAMHRWGDSELRIKFDGQGNPWFNGRKYDTSVRVDEGLFSDVIHSNGLIDINDIAQDLIPAADVLRVLRFRYAPDATVEPSPFMGNKRSERHDARESYKALVDAKLPDILKAKAVA